MILRAPLAATLFTFTTLVAGCGKKEAAPPTAAPATAPAPTTDAAPTEAERVAAAIARNEEADAKERARWTPELETAALQLAERRWKDTTEALTTILASPHREPGNAERDAWRHPLETLTFFGVTPTSTVIEVGAGGGWYTELLAPLLAAQGGYGVAGPDAGGPMDKMATAYGKSLDAFLAKSKLFAKVTRATVAAPPFTLGPPGLASHVLAIREMHNWQRRGTLDAYLAAIHDALAESGTFGLVAHRGKPGSKGEDTADSGYLAEAWVIARVEAAGFKLVASSEVNANPSDSKDYPKGVWTLPPNFAEGEATKARYAGIGESDRMTLKFTKVARP
ncbi:MAG: class I SAM-dependent methyltransferase [Kofleriaceae bacterium]|nr:class I SAM-dependent methyltransferase [Kofleriaceae bacterium]